MKKLLVVLISAVMLLSIFSSFALAETYTAVDGSTDITTPDSSLSTTPLSTSSLRSFTHWDIYYDSYSKKTIKIGVQMWVRKYWSVNHWHYKVVRIEGRFICYQGTYGSFFSTLYANGTKVWGPYGSALGAATDSGWIVPINSSGYLVYPNKIYNSGVRVMGSNYFCLWLSSGRYLKKSVSASFTTGY